MATRLSFLLMLMLCVVCTPKVFAQHVGIGTSTPHPSAMLDVSSTSRGLLIPRMTAAQRLAISNPVAGLMVYQIDFTQGFYFFNGMVWNQISVGPSINYWNQNGNNISSNNSGNVGVGTPLPGAKLEVVVDNNSTNEALVLRKSNNDTLFLLSNNGRVGIGVGRSELGRSLNIGGSGLNLFNASGFYSGSVIPSESNSGSITIWSQDGANDAVILQPFWGRVGIGTNSPTEKLHVNGNVIVSGDITADGKGIVRSSDAEQLQIRRLSTAANLNFSLAPNQTIAFTVGYSGFSAPPMPVGGFFSTGVNFDRYLTITYESITSTSCSVRITNVGSTSTVTASNGVFNCVLIGPR